MRGSVFTLRLINSHNRHRKVGQSKNKIFESLRFSWLLNYTYYFLVVKSIDHFGLMTVLVVTGLRCEIFGLLSAPLPDVTLVTELTYITKGFAFCRRLRSAFFQSSFSRGEAS
jgi:hypothetical protein